MKPWYFGWALSSLLITLFSVTGCNSEASLEGDAQYLCDSFDPKVLKNRYDEDMWFSDVEMSIYTNLQSSMKTAEFKGVVASRSDVKNYDKVYPHIKGQVEDVLGGSWECQDMASFYVIRLNPEINDAAEETSVDLVIRQLNGLIFSIEDIEVDFSNSESAIVAIEKNFGSPEAVEIHLSESSQESLPQILNVMTEVGVQKVKTVTTIP